MRGPVNSVAPKIDAKPLTAAEFEAAMAAFLPFSSGTSLGLAISGGPDSMALALMMKDWACQYKVKLQAFIVDHKLRENSGEEATRTSAQLKTLSIPATILSWEHQPVTSRLHLLARKARYQLLTDASRALGIKELFLAHHQEDQAETILMRLAKGSGIDGLAGISPQVEMNGVRLLRPFLNFSKARLVASCEAAKSSYISDPSNQSEKFARGRLRRVMPLLADEGLTTERLCELGARAADAKDALDHVTKSFLKASSDQNLAGAIRVDLEALRALPRAIALRALVICLQTIHYEDYAPEHASLSRLLEQLLNAEAMTPRTLHGCLISQTASEVIIMREYSAITDDQPVQMGKPIIWDGRWSVTLNSIPNDLSYRLRPLGNPPHELLDKHAPALRHLIPQGRARASLPTVWHEKNLIFIPSLTTYSVSEPIHAQLLAHWPPL